MRLMWIVEHAVWSRPRDRKGALGLRVEQQTSRAAYGDAIVMHGYFFALVDRIANCVLPPSYTGRK